MNPIKRNIVIFFCLIFCLLKLNAQTVDVIDNKGTIISVDESPINEIQDLSLNGNTLTITGNTGATDIDLTAYLDNTDEQEITEFTFNTTTNIITLTLESGGTETINLSSLEESAEIITNANNIVTNATDISTNATNIQSNADDITALETEQTTQNTNITTNTNNIVLKEDAANKSTTTTLGTSDILFPTQNAVKTYVDGQITATADDDITGVTFNGTDLTVEEGTTSFSADLSALEESAEIIANTNLINTNTTNIQTNADDIDTLEAEQTTQDGLISDNTNAIALKENTANKSTDAALGTSDVLFPTQNAVKTYVDGQIAALPTDSDPIVGNEVTNATAGGSLVLGGAGTTGDPYTLDVADGAINTTELADGAVTLGKLVNGTAEGQIFQWNDIDSEWELTTISGGNTDAWSLTGNTIANGQFLGTTNNQDLVFKTNDIESGRISVFQEFTTFGYQASSAFQGTAIGRLAVVGGNAALAIGYRANATAQNSIAIGSNAKVNSGNNTIAIGSSADIDSQNVIAIGSGNTVSTGSNNAIAIGSTIEIESQNAIAMGTGSFFGSNANSSIAIGEFSSIGDNAQNSIAIGRNAGINGNNSNSIALGNNAKVNATGFITNATAIGANAEATQSNTLILGNDANVGIGTNTPNAKLEVDSGTNNDSGVELSRISDSTPTVDAQPIGVNNTGKVVVIEKATLVDNGDGTATFSNAPGTADDVTITTQASSSNSVITSALWLDTSSVQITSNQYTQGKSFTIPGGTLQDKNAVRIICYRRKGSGNQQIRLNYGGQTFYTSGQLGNNSARIEFIIFADGNSQNQKSFMDDANTGGSGQQFGTTNVNSDVDQVVNIFLRKVNGNDSGVLDFCSAESLIIGN